MNNYQPAQLEHEPSYVAQHRSGTLQRRAQQLWDMMSPCQLCPRQCGADRVHGEQGFCGVQGTALVVASAHPHFGEERPLVGTGGSGAIFFAHCNLRCDFCQNWELSFKGQGQVYAVEDLAALMLGLQNQGCHNINLVTPTHYSAQILQALDLATDQGLRLPLVWNTSGWEQLEVLELLDGIVDIYLPDFKFWDQAMAAKYACGAVSYPEQTRQALLAMFAQVGPAQINAQGLMLQGMIIRHLVLPHQVSGSEQIIDWIADHLPQAHINIMAQYHPEHKAVHSPELGRGLTRGEYAAVVNRAAKRGLVHVDLSGAWLLAES